MSYHFKKATFKQGAAATVAKAIRKAGGVVFGLVADIENPVMGYGHPESKAIYTITIPETSAKVPQTVRYVTQNVERLAL